MASDRTTRRDFLEDLGGGRGPDGPRRGTGGPRPAGHASGPSQPRETQPEPSPGSEGSRPVHAGGQDPPPTLRRQLERPRGWAVQAGIHTYRCQHGNWWFLPWHRAYLYYFERLIQDAIGDPTFALPYWDWTDSSQLTLPAPFRDPNSPRTTRTACPSSTTARPNSTGASTTRISAAS